jgi:hypothetical protein
MYMNTAIDSTHAKSVTIVEAFKDIEYDIHALVSMANIAENLFDDLQKYQKLICIANNLASFAVLDVTSRAEALKRKYFAVLYQKDVQT